MKIEIEFTLKETGVYGTEKDLDWEEAIRSFADAFWWACAELQQAGEIR